MLSAVIIDNDENTIYLLTDLISGISSIKIKIIGIASNLEDGVEIIKNTQPDIVFLDINLHGEKEFKIYNEFISPHFKIIIYNTFQKYAIDVLRISALSCLLKPEDLNELKELLQKVSDELINYQKQLQIDDKIKILQTPKIFGDHIILAVDNGFIIGNTMNIEYCYAHKIISVLVTNTQKEFLVTKSLGELKEVLPPKHFYLIHKSYLININYVRKFDHTNDKYVLMDSGIKIPVSYRTKSINSKVNGK